MEELKWRCSTCKNELLMPNESPKWVWCIFCYEWCKYPSKMQVLLFELAIILDNPEDMTLKCISLKIV